MIKRIDLVKRMMDYARRENIWYKFFDVQLFGYESKWHNIHKNFNRIVVYGLECVSIGETLPRIFAFLDDKKVLDSNSYHLFLPTFFFEYRKGIFNKGLFSIFNEECNFVTIENFFFWLYVFIFHYSSLDLSNFDKYKKRIGTKNFQVKYGTSLIKFTENIEKDGMESLKNMGIKGDYICLHAREVITKTDNFIIEDTTPTTFAQDAKLQTYEKACNYMYELGYQSIRMGKDERIPCEIYGTVDYANNFYADWLDFYIPSKCKFMIGCNSGLSIVTQFWGKALLLTNVINFAGGYEWLPVTDCDIYIPKKFYSLRKGRLLNLLEILDVSNKCSLYTNFFQQEDIQLIDNTEDEILSATREINSKIDKTWDVTDSERALYEKYWRIMDDWKRKHKHAFTFRYQYTMLQIPIAYSYLKENIYLLDVEVEM